MPIYGYRCSECGHELEVLQRMSAEPLRVCAECGGPLTKLLYPVGVRFRGSGFYTTDYKNGGSSKKGSTSSDGGSEGSRESASTDKPAGSDKAETKKTESPASKE